MRKHLTKAEKKHIHQILRERLLQREEVRFAYLFGSFTLEGSFGDIDVAVYVTPENLHRSDPLMLSFEIADFLELAVGVAGGCSSAQYRASGVAGAARGKPLMARCWEELADFAEQVTLRWWDTEGMRYAAM